MSGLPASARPPDGAAGPGTEALPSVVDESNEFMTTGSATHAGSILPNHDIEVDTAA